MSKLSHSSDYMDTLETERIKREFNLKTNYDPPPIPLREFDWSCVDDNYEPNDPIGYGRTEAEAVKEWLELMEERK